MDQDNTMDFKALRAKFQDEETLLLRQPRTKPFVPAKPSAVPPPQSPTHTLPAGARPSLLTSISQAADRNSVLAPRVIFKEDKKDKKPLIQAKSKEKSSPKVKSKLGKNKNGGLKEGKSDPTEEKKMPQDGNPELVGATPPPKTAPPKKKGFRGFRKSSKKETPANSILDTPSPDLQGLAPLMPTSPAPVDPTAVDPAPVDLALVDPAPEPGFTPKLKEALRPPNPTLEEPPAVAFPSLDPTPVTATPKDPPPQAASSATPLPLSPTPPPKTETPAKAIAALPVSVSPSPRPPGPTPPARVTSLLPRPTSPPPPTPTPLVLSTPPPPVTSSPSPPPPTVPTPPAVATPSPSPPPTPVLEPELEAGVEAGPPVSTLAVDPPSRSQSPLPERPLSALSALERAEEMGPSRRTSTCDPRVFSALEKARRKIASPTPTTSSPATPTAEEPYPPLIPALPVMNLPPIDYQEQYAQVNGINHRQPSPALEGIVEEGAGIIPEMLVVPPPPPRRALPTVESLAPPPDKPSRPPKVELPSPHQNAVEIPAPPSEFCEEDSVPQQAEAQGPEPQEESFAELQAPGLMEPIWGNGEAVEPLEQGVYLDEVNVQGQQDEVQECGAEVRHVPGDLALSDSASSPGSPIGRPEAEEGSMEARNVLENVHATGKQKNKTLGAKKRTKGPPKNPYAETQPAQAESQRSSWFSKSEKKATPEGPDEKELKKKEKQRLEKEKKEQKEQREREKKEQKEREKKENEMKKKFKITGQEEAMYQATVTMTTKGRKDDLALKSGDIISIIRTTNCPKGKWLARDSSNTFGYVSVSHVELDVKEMMELGKKAVGNRNNSTLESERTSAGSRNSNHYPLSTGSFSDDSEEWTGDEEEMFSSPTASTDPGPEHTTSMLEEGSREHSVYHEHTASDVSTDSVDQQARHEALQKLSTFFHAPRDTSPPAAEEPDARIAELRTSPEVVAVEQAPSSIKEVDPLLPDMIILPPPDLYADISFAD